MSGVVSKRGPGRPPGGGKKRFQQQKTSVDRQRKMIGKSRNWTQKWVSDGHLELFKWTVVEGSEKNRRFEEEMSAQEVVAVAQADSESDEKEEVLSRRTRTARGEEFGLFVTAPAASASGHHQNAAQPIVNMTRYKCPLEGCEQLFFKVAGLLAHTRMKHKIRKEKVDVPGCRFLIDASGNLVAPPVGGVAADNDEEEDEPPAPAPAPVRAPAPAPRDEAEPQQKKLRLVLKMPILPTH